jgi:signal transduction histidine kinase
MKDFSEDLDAVGRIEAIPTLLEVICRTTGMGFAAVARVTEDRWVACAVRDEIAFGLAHGGELKVETTICNEIRGSGQPVVIDNVAGDELWCRHPTPALYGFQSYISMPIFLTDGVFFGTLCAIDPAPARLNNPQTIGMFKLFAELIGLHLNTLDRLKVSESALVNERETAQLREQFMAVLGHDLRNPLQAIMGAADVLRRMPLDQQAARVAEMVGRSAVRMAELIDNVTDLTRSRLGGGLVLNLELRADLVATLAQIVEEARLVRPDREINSVIQLDHTVNCDRARIAQMFSNLLANALTHGQADGPVWVTAYSTADRFELSVANLGDPIDPSTLTHLFQPFSRASVKPGQQGLGLGLYIASEIARAHGGSLTVDSDHEETRFTFSISAIASVAAS